MIPGVYRARPRLCPILCPPPNPTECYPVSARRWKRQSALHLSHLVAIPSVRCKWLILRAHNLRDQEVPASSIPDVLPIFVTIASQGVFEFYLPGCFGLSPEI